MLALCACVASAAAQERSPTAEQVKAAYLLKFPAFVSWPAEAFADATAPFLFGVLDGDDVFAELSRQALGRQVQGRPVLVRRITRVDASSPLHVLYVGSSFPETRLPAAGLPSTLLVADAPNALERGAIVNFMTVDHKVRFELSLMAAQRARLRLSSQLIEVAVRVKGFAP